MQTNELTTLIAAILLTRPDFPKGTGAVEVKSAIKAANALIAAAQEGH